MSEELKLELLGSVNITLNGVTLGSLRYAKSVALLAYLAVTGRSHSREALATLLWGESADKEARASLRGVLSKLARALPQHLVLSRDRVALNHESPYALDVETFLAKLAAADLGTDLGALGEAVALYRGELLEGLRVHDAPEFEAWLLVERERLRHLMLGALHSLVVHHAEREEHAAGITYVRRLLELEPWREDAHRQMMLLLAASGQKEAALAHYQSCRRVLAGELGLEPSAETVALYEAIRSGAASFRPAEPSPSHHFPAQFGPCLGREQELLDLTALLQEPDCRLLTLLGPGGVGKTRLALALVERLAAKGAFPDGFYFVSLATVTSAEQLWGALANTLALELREGEDARAQVLAQLTPKACFLVLDNFEQLLEAARHLADIAAAAPRVRLLVTSRTPLDVRAEHRFPLEGLAYPPTRDVPDALAYSAVHLFVEAARRVQPGFSLSSQNAGAITAICRAVAGLPLALELAASWTRMLDCETIASEINRNLTFLKSSLKDVPERHRSMAAVFAHSWDLLPPESQRLLAQLSVFRGPLSLETVLEVAQASVLELATLLDHSLLKRTLEGHYQIHELLRQFAAERLGALGPLAEEVEARHSHHYLKLVAAQRAALHGSAARQSVTALQRQFGDIRKAWAWALEHHCREALEESLEGLASFYDFTGLFEEAETLLSSAIASERLEVDPGLLSHLLVWQAHFLNRRGQSEAAIEAAQEALGLAEDRGNPERRARAHNLLGELLLFKGDYAQAKLHQQQALAFYEKEGGQPLADALSRMGVIAWRTGDYPGATTLFERALPLQRELGNEVGRAQVLSSVAGLCWEQGELEQAQIHLQQAAELYEVLDHKMGKAYSVGRLGILHHDLGGFERALEVNGEALRLFRDLGYEEGLAHFLGNRGNIFHDLGAFEEALACHQQALELDESLGHEGDVGRHLGNIGTVLKAKGNVAEALGYYDQALPRLRAVGSSCFVLEPLLGKAEALFAQARYVEAEALANEGLTMACDLGDEDYLVAAQVLLAKLAAVIRGDRAAVQFLREKLAATEGREEQAPFYNELWLLGQDDAHAPALERYQELYERYPSFINKTRLEKLQQAAK